MMTQRRRRFAGWLGLLALVGQMVLPTLHAQWWAQRAGDPRLAVFCGELSPALLDKLGDSPVLPDLLKALRDRAGGLGGLACPLCSSLHASHLAVPAKMVWHVADTRPSPPRSLPLPAAPRVQLVFLPGLRAPPVSLRA